MTGVIASANGVSVLTASTYVELRPHAANFVRLGRIDAVCYSDRADAEIWANVGEEIAVVLFDGDPAPQLLLFFCCRTSALASCPGRINQAQRLVVGRSIRAKPLLARLCVILPKQPTKYLGSTSRWVRKEVPLKLHHQRQLIPFIR